MDIDMTPTRTILHQLNPTEERIAAAILKALEPTGEELVAWVPIRDRLPGGFWDKSRILVRLHESGMVYLVQIGGSPFVGLADDVDAEIARRYRAKGQVRPVLVA